MVVRSCSLGSILQTAIGNTTDATLASQLLTNQAGAAANGIATNQTRINNLTAASSTACATRASGA